MGPRSFAITWGACVCVDAVAAIVETVMIKNMLFQCLVNENTKSKKAQSKNEN